MLQFHTHDIIVVECNTWYIPKEGESNYGISWNAFYMRTPVIQQLEVSCYFIIFSILWCYISSNVCSCSLITYVPFLFICRSVYTKRIIDISAKVRKQKQEIDRVLADTRTIQKEINILSGKLERTFTVVEGTAYKVKVLNWEWFWCDTFDV